MNLNEMRDRAHKTATEHGFTDATPAEDFMLMTSELAEALEDVRAGRGVAETFYTRKVSFGGHATDGSLLVIDGVEILSEKLCPDGALAKPCGIPSELADIIIRIGHFCGKHGIDLDAAVAEKMAYNEARPYKHGGKVL